MRTAVRLLSLVVFSLVASTCLCAGAPPSATEPSLLILEIYHLDIPDNLRFTLDDSGRLEIVELSIQAISRVGTTSLPIDEARALLLRAAGITPAPDSPGSPVEGDVYTLTVKSGTGFLLISRPAAQAPATLIALVERLTALAADVELTVNEDYFVMSQPAAVDPDRTSPRTGIVILQTTDLDSGLSTSLNHCAKHRAILHHISRQAFEDLVRRVHTYEFLYRVDSASVVQMRLWPPER